MEWDYIVGVVMGCVMSLLCISTITVLGMAWLIKDIPRDED